MSFLTTQPEELAAAAGKLETIGSAMVAQNAAAAAPTTTGVIPAAADEISVLQAPLFTAYGTLYQQVSAEAAAVAASRRRHFGPVGGAATTRCPGRTAAVSRGHDGKPATNPTDPAVAGLGARCAPVDSRTRGRNREPGCAVQRAAD